MAKVLLVDDSEATRRVTGRLLRVFGNDVIEATNAWQGLSILETTPVDLVLLDLGLPGMSGLGFLNDMSRRGRWRSLPVVVMSGLRVDQSVMTVYGENVRQWMVKGEFGAAELVDGVKRWGERRRAG